MDPTTIAALIGMVGTLGAAFISAAYGRTQGVKFAAFHRLSLYLGGVALVSLLVAALIFAVLYDPTEARIRAALPDRTGFEQVVYPRVGLGFSMPEHWQIDDASFRFGSGDIDLIRNHDPAAASISQGLKLRFVNVQESYVNNPEAEINNQLDVWRKIDADVSVRPVTFSGLPASRFSFEQSTGKRTGHIEQTWVRLTNRVKLHIISFSNLDDISRSIFQRERDDILQTFVVDRQRLRQLANEAGV